MPADRDKELIARRFDRQAEVYESVTPVQSMMADHLMTLISKTYPNTDEPLSLLDLGCGPGRVARRFAQAYPQSEITGIDVAQGMIEKARDIVPTGLFVVGDAEEYLDHCDETFDVIASNAALQWFEHPIETLRRCLAQLKPGGLLAIATFGDGTFRELRESFDAAYCELKREPAEHVHHMPTVDYWRSAMPELVVEDTVHTLTFSTVREFLRSVQRAGATHSPSDQSTLTRSLYRAMADHYRQQFAVAGGVTASYHVLYLTGRNDATA